jgi:hypothetical protein
MLPSILVLKTSCQTLHALHPAAISTSIKKRNKSASISLATSFGSPHADHKNRVFRVHQPCNPNQLRKSVETLRVGDTEQTPGHAMQNSTKEKLHNDRTPTVRGGCKLLLCVDRERDRRARQRYLVCSPTFGVSNIFLGESGYATMLNLVSWLKAIATVRLLTLCITYFHNPFRRPSMHARPG